MYRVVVKKKSRKVFLNAWTITRLSFDSLFATTCLVYLTFRKKYFHKSWWNWPSMVAHFEQYSTNEIYVWLMIFILKNDFSMTLHFYVHYTIFFISNSFISNWTEIIKQLQFWTAMVHKQLFFITVLYKTLWFKKFKAFKKKRP